MKKQTFLSLSFLTASLVSLSSLVYAHGSHEDNAEPKAKPTTCKQLADTEHYAVDLKDSATQALKARCDAAKAAKKPVEAVEKKTEAPK